jgi:multimeric flavodoxin WrbA
MNTLAILGAANKGRNTATMLKSALEGATSLPGSQGETVCLYDIDYKGCRGCHSCKLNDESRLGRCAVRDGLSPVLEQAIEADVLLIGSPIYYSDVTGQTRAFLERLLFPSMTYDRDRVPQYPKRIKVGWVFTMNAPGAAYTALFEGLVGLAGRLLGDSEHTIAFQTQQFDDYSRYAASQFDVEAVKRRHIEQFPLDCQAAFDMGRRLAEASKG